MSKFSMILRYCFVVAIMYLLFCCYLLKSEAATEPYIAVIYTDSYNETDASTERPTEPLKHVIDGCPLDSELQETIYKMCESEDIAFEFVMAVIAVETGETWKTGIISKTHDYGLMQINRSNHKKLKKALGITDFLDPVQNVSAGLYMLKDLFDKYEDPALVLMAYNMGEGKAKKLWKKGTYSSKYSRRVLGMMDQMKISTI